MKKLQTNKTEFLSYDKLAWTEPIVGPPEEYADDTELFTKIIKEYSTIEPKTLLHLGCGAGGNDYTFKKYFKVTGIDISSDMLKMAKKINPEVKYHNHDMRCLKLDKTFDAVAIPDSIGYMVTEKDLRGAIFSAYNHLKPGGILLIVTHTKEEFRDNNFLYTGSNKDTEITVFENNYIVGPAKTTYEATIIYLIRKNGKLKIYSDIHTIGLFKIQVWLDIFKEFGFEVKKIKLEHSYDSFILGEGKYPLTIFACLRPIK
ncbi:MAG: class I SAM-dependent methyltransferase [Actinobacteria bacterium]|nr:class I SAM-dependent methyltransferase [Actinomycetota bacterium]MBM3712856.1 class I SAM-dependent methyltransferase [Actinomycetota bacterium]